jgi:hypothetical protein
MKENDINIYELQRHLRYEDYEIPTYLIDNEYSIIEDDLGTFQKLWILTSDYVKQLLKHNFENEITKIFEEIEVEENENW